MTRDNIHRGVQGETAVLNRLVQKGFEVLIPWGGHRRYDIAYFVSVEHRNFGFFVHRESYLVRIQVKIGRLTPDEVGTGADAPSRVCRPLIGNSIRLVPPTYNFFVVAHALRQAS